MDDIEKHWWDLSQFNRTIYEDKANYLVDNGYYTGEAYRLAQIMAYRQKEDA